jgi:LacI family transcriptional regulator
MAVQRTQRRVRIEIDLQSSLEQDILSGVVRYTRTEADWIFSVKGWREPWAVNSGDRFAQIDGLIAEELSEEIIEDIVRRGIPAVTVSSPQQGDLPRVCPDNFAVGELAAEHFLNRGFHSLAYRGDPSYAASVLRRDGFESQARKGKADFVDMVGSEELLRKWQFEREMADTLTWLKKLPKPTGVLAFTSMVGRRILEACRLAGIRVPEDIAVLAGDSDFLSCHASHPRLSSVDLDAERVGYHAAALLNDLMDGKGVSDRTTLVSPLGVTTRESSDVLAIEDEALSKALAFIHRNACEGINVQDVVRQVPICRRSLERRFTACLGRSPRDEIRRLQINRAKELLTRTDLPVADIATRVGFRTTGRFVANFKTIANVSPSTFRRRDPKTD